MFNFWFISGLNLYNTIYFSFFLFFFFFFFFFFSPSPGYCLRPSLSLSRSLSLLFIFKNSLKFQTATTFSSDVRLTRAWYRWKGVDGRNNLSSGLPPETARIRRNRIAAAALRLVAVARRRRPSVLKIFEGFCRGSRGQQKPSRISPIRRSVSV